MVQKREIRGQAACTQHRAANSHAVPHLGRGLCLWALHLISPSVYSLGLDISTPTMGRGSMCELEPIKSVEEPQHIGESLISNIPKARKRWKGFFYFPSLLNVDMYRNTL